MTTRICLNDTRAAPLSSLLDTGASLSSIDAELLKRLGGTPTGSPMRVHGLGDTQTLGWATITFFVPARDRHGYEVMLESTLDFHVLPNFAPGLCLGLDFIEGQGVGIDAATSVANIGRFAFDVFHHMPQPFAREAQLCSTEPVELPARTSVWVPVDTSPLSPDVDYTFHPRLMTDAAESFSIAGPAALATRETRHVLVSNFGNRPVLLDRRTPIADALAATLGDAAAADETGEVFDLGLPTPSSALHSAQEHVEPWRPEPDIEDDDPASPLDLFEGTEDPANAMCRDAETVLVDGHWKVGVDADGRPHSKIVDLLRRHRDAFALDGRPGLVHGPEMTIPLRDEANLRPEPPRRASPEKRAAIDAAIDQLLDWNVIEPSQSPVSFPVLMVRQYNKWRFCVDYRQLNAATVSDRYPLPTTDAVFQTLQGKRWFSSLDAIRGYHQHQVAPADRWKTAFVCHRGLYQYRTVPFGLKNAPAVFQRLMDRLLGELRWRTAVVYIDDVVAANATLDEHVETLETILQRAEQIGLRFSPAKCTFGVPSLVLLGRKVSGAGVAVWGDRAKAVQQLARPQTLRDVYHVLGLFGYYRSFVHRFAELAAPLTKLTRGWRYESDGDRSRLVRKDGTPASADREMVEWGAEQQQSFDTLKSAIASPPILAHPDPSRPFILYVDASKMAFAAILHQVFADEDLLPAAVHSIAPLPLASSAVSPERWSSWLRADRFFGPILRRLADGEEDSDWVLENGALIRRVDDRWALPEAALPLALRQLHDRQAHFGYTKTYLAISRSFWRPRLSEAVRAWVMHCPVCQKVKTHPRVGELDVSADAQEPFTKISVDLVLGLPASHGRDAVLAMTDAFSRMVLLEPCKSTIDAAGVVAIISNRILRLGWRPRRIVSDSEARMTGQTMQALAVSLGAELVPSTPHHQQANPVERSIQTVQTALRALIADGKGPWDRAAVPAVELAMNSTPSVSTGYRPFDLVFISHPSAAHALFDGTVDGADMPFADRLAIAAERLEDARRAIASARTRQKERYDASRAPLPDLRAGDMVYVRLRDRPIPGLGSGKLDAKQAGPYPVREVLSPHRVRLQLPGDLRISDEFNVEQLDVAPLSPDPFAGDRGGITAQRQPVSSTTLDLAATPSPEPVPADESVPARPRRAPRPPKTLRDFDMGVLRVEDDASWQELLRGPVPGVKQVLYGERTLSVRERPIAFQSRLTTVSEKRLVAAELELCCLAWAFARFAHLLEGAPVTVVTDHAPMGAMLTSAAGTQYGPTVTRCRALLLPHLHNLRFIHRPGRVHGNVDALSRLVA